MMYEAITLDIEADIAVLTLNRPAVMNAMNTQMRAEILHAVRHSASAARVLVLTGAGSAFC
ncbi:MAG: enoyl-CoA hydratase-related protein, partial [Rhodobacterales bacterium]